MKFDLAALQRLIDDGLVSVQKHPKANLFIYNYTQKAQFSGMWDELLIQCRGLILDKNGEVKAYSLPKFFNLDEHINKGGSLPEEPFEVFDKYDGSLGILYWYRGKPYIATRGSFTSDQAVAGTKMLHEMKDVWPYLSKELTYCFEIIYPENRIVVDYGSKRGLVYLATFDPKTGKEVVGDALPCEMARCFNDIQDAQMLKLLACQNAEGFVIRYKSGLRLKVKFDEYVRLHRILTGVTERTLWEIARAGNLDDYNKIIDRVPDEFHQWVRVTWNDLWTKHDTIRTVALKVVEEHKLTELPRKEAAVIVMDQYKQISDIIFKLLDGRPVNDAIWKGLRPPATKPFKVTEDV
jgi:hypothetical protein